GFANVLGSRDLGRFAKHPVDALWDELVVHIADRRAGAEARRGVALAALGRNPQLGDVAFLPLQLGRPLHQLLRLIGGAHDGVDVAVQLDPKPNDWLAGLGDALDDPVGPSFLDADDNNGSNVRIAPDADQRAEVELQVGSELEAAVSVRQCHRALDVVGHRLACGVGEVVQRQNDHVVAYANPAVLAAPAPKCEISVRLSRHDAIPLGAYQRFVLRLWT